VVWLFYLAQVFSLLAAVFMVLASLEGDRGRLLRMQSVDCLANLIADVLLGGFTGAVLCLGNIVRDNYGTLERKFQFAKGNGGIVDFMFFLAGFLTAIVRGGCWLMLPTSLAYSIALKYLDGIRMKAVLAIDLICWLVYDIQIKSVPVAVADIISFVCIMYRVMGSVSEGQQIFHVTVKPDKDSKKTKDGKG